MEEVRSEVRESWMIAEVPSGRLGFISVPRILACRKYPGESIEELVINYFADRKKGNMSGKYAFTKSLREVRFLFCQTSEHSAATRSLSSFLIYAIFLVDILLGLSLHERIRP